MGSLFGDLEAAIDLMLDGDPEIKYEVAVADSPEVGTSSSNNRGGYQALLNAMRRKNVKPTTSAQERLMQTLEADQEFYTEKLQDLRNIKQRGDNYRVRLVVEHNRYSRTFTSLSEAQDWRFKMETLHAQTVASL